jgi:hypothetical protein
MLLRKCAKISCLYLSTFQNIHALFYIFLVIAGLVKILDLLLLKSKVESDPDNSIKIQNLTNPQNWNA